MLSDIYLSSEMVSNSRFTLINVRQIALRHIHLHHSDLQMSLSVRRNFTMTSALYPEPVHGLTKAQSSYYLTPG